MLSSEALNGSEGGIFPPNTNSIRRSMLQHQRSLDSYGTAPPIPVKFRPLQRQNTRPDLDPDLSLYANINRLHDYDHRFYSNINANDQSAFNSLTVFKDQNKFPSKMNERWSFSDSYELRQNSDIQRESETPPEPEPAPSFILGNQLPLSTQNGDYDHIGNYLRANSELGTRDGHYCQERKLYSSCSGLYLDPFLETTIRLHTNPLYQWRNRKRSRSTRAWATDQRGSSTSENQRLPGVLPNITSEQQMNSRMLAGYHSNPMLQRLRLKEWERSRFLTKFDIKEHRLIVSSLKTFISRSHHHQTPMSNHTGLSGMLCINLIGGMSLHSSQTLLRDLYCVFEVENVRRARSVIRTNTECFTWEEEFELEINLVQSLTCLLYQWDRRERHKLCFYGNIDLTQMFLNLNAPESPNTIKKPLLATNRADHSTGIVTSGEDSGCFTGSSSATISQDLGVSALANVEAACRKEETTAFSPKMDKIALQLEPTGLVYLELAWFPMRLAYARTKSSPSANHNIPLFGCPLSLVLNRERAKIPYIIEKCISEIDRRGLNICGIYRICGALKLKMQLRNMFELAFYPLESSSRDILEDLQSDTPYAKVRTPGSRKHTRSDVNLNPEKVPDIHVITAVLKDYLRELPEPLVTDYLYRMLLDAIKVTTNKAVGSKLIFSVLDCIPQENQSVLYYILDHLKRVSTHSQCNRMTTHQISTVFGPLLFYPSPALSSKLSPDMLNAHWQTSMLTQLLDMWPGSQFVYTMLKQNDSSRPLRMPLRSVRRGNPNSYRGYYPEQDVGYLSEPGSLMDSRKLPSTVKFSKSHLTHDIMPMDSVVRQRILQHGKSGHSSNVLNLQHNRSRYFGGLDQHSETDYFPSSHSLRKERYHTDLPMRRVQSGDYDAFSYDEYGPDAQMDASFRRLSLQTDGVGSNQIIPYDPRFYRTRSRR